MSNADSSASPAQLDLSMVYQEVRAEIATTDDVSFKLMGLVPLVSGAALLGLVFSEKAPALAGTAASPAHATAVTMLCLFAAAVTLGLFRWELRNVQSCNWLIARSAALEVHGLARLALDPRLLERPAAPQRIGKEIAEKCIYVSTVVAWLALPIAIGAFDRADASWRMPIAIIAALIGIAAVFSLFGSARFAPSQTAFFATKPLPKDRDAVAPDGSDVRVLLALTGGGMAHFELPARATSKAIRHRSVEEIWLFLSGQGEMWRQQDARGEVVPVGRGDCITIPKGTHFQFRSLSDEPLSAVGVTMPPWPGEHEAIPVPGPWSAQVREGRPPPVGG